MADINNNDPSSLYDEEFMKKREAMFANADSDAELSSGRDESKDETYDDFEEEDKTGGLLARFKRTFQKRRYEEDDEDDYDGYDIFDLDDILETEKKERAEREAAFEQIVQNDEEEPKASITEESADESEAAKQPQSLTQTSSDSEKDEVENVEIEAEEAKSEETEEAEEVEAAAAEEDEAEDIRIYQKIETEEPEIKEVPVSEAFSNEILTEYKVEDINALLESVGIKPISPQDESSAAKKQPEQPKEEQEEKDEIATDETKVISQPTKVIDKKLVKSALENASEKNEVVSASTRHFNISKLFSQKNRLNSGSADSDNEQSSKAKRKRFIDNFRVLEKMTQDKPILERVSQEDATGNVVDIVEAEAGEDLFDAVEKADKDPNVVAQAAAKAAAKQKTKERASAAVALMKSLNETSKKENNKMIALLVLTTVSLILSFLAVIYKSDGALEFLCGNGARVYTLISLVLFISGMAISYDRFKDAIDSFKKFKINSSVCMLLICAFVLIQGIVVLITGMTEQTGITAFTAYGLFVILEEAYARSLSRATLSKNLSVMIHAKDGLVGLQSVDNKSDAASLGHGISKNGSPIIYYCAPSDVPDDVQSLASSESIDERFYGYGGVAVMLCSLIVALVLSLSGKTTISFAACFVGEVCLCFPILKRVINERLLSDCVSSASANSVAVTSIDSCEDLGNSNAVVVDSKDILEAGVSKFRVVPASRMASSDAVVFAAATLKNTSSLLANAFDDFLEESGIELPEAEDVQYEERLGYSSWVVSRRVLVGNREMLVAHSIECPSAEEEERYSKGRSVMYVVVEGVIVATFIVSYYVRSKVRKSVAEFNKTGLVLMINSAEPCLNEAIVASKLAADITAIKIISTKGTEIIAAYKKSKSAHVDNGLLCSKKHRNIINLINSAHSLYEAQRLARLINIVGMVITFIIFVVCIAFNASNVISPITIIFLQGLWSIISYFIGKLRIK